MTMEATRFPETSEETYNPTCFNNSDDHLFKYRMCSSVSSLFTSNNTFTALSFEFPTIKFSHVANQISCNIIMVIQSMFS